MEEIDDKIDAWHESDTGVPLHEYLGMTLEEYGEWVKTGRLPNDPKTGG